MLPLTCPFRWVAKIIHNESFFFSTWVLFHKHSPFTWQQGKGEGIYLTPLYHFHLPHRHLDINCAITAESSPLHIASSQTRTGNLLFLECKSLTTKLRAFQTNHSKITFVQFGMLCAVVWFCRVHLQKQPPEVFLKKVVLKNSAKFTRKHLHWRLFSCSSSCSLWRNMVRIDPSINFRGPLAVK